MYSCASLHGSSSDATAAGYALTISICSSGVGFSLNSLATLSLSSGDFEQSLSMNARSGFASSSHFVGSSGLVSTFTADFATISILPLVLSDLASLW